MRALPNSIFCRFTKEPFTSLLLSNTNKNAIKRIVIMD